MQQALNDYTLRAYLHARDRFEQAIARMAVREEGQTTAEYVAVMVLIAAVIGVLAQNETLQRSVSEAIGAAFDRVKSMVEGANGNG